jgi:hypothetical protein
LNKVGDAFLFSSTNNKDFFEGTVKRKGSLIVEYGGGEDVERDGIEM